MKSYVLYLQGLYVELLVEALHVFPTLQKDIRRDEKRLLSLIESRGLPFLMVDCPAMGKHLDKCLSIGQLTPPQIPGFGVWRRGVSIPRLFKGFWRLVFDDSGCLLSDPDVRAIRLLRQLLMLAKKFDMPCPESSTWKSIDDFFKIDAGIRRPSLLWDDDDPRLDNVRHLHFGDASSQADRPTELFGELSASREPLGFRATDVLQGVCDIVAAELGRLEPSEWVGKHGPGAVADQRHTQFKYDFPNWPAKLDHVFPMSLFAFANYDGWVRHVTSDGSDSTILLDHEPASKLISVPKTLKGPRLIAAEPVAHQWCQQVIMKFFTSRVKETTLGNCVDFSSQEPNGSLALEASHTGSHLTMDLSSASDRLSCWTVERVFRASPSIIAALHASRTRWVYNPIDRKSPRYSRIKKFACMGSACTFPVQSIVFSCVAIASILLTENVRVSLATIRAASRMVRVFGDDIIVPTHCMEAVQGYMDHLQLEVNQSKTFGTGKFRESCGVDAYDGHDVTPVYIRAYPEWSRPESVASSVATHNNFFDKGYFGLAQKVKSTLPHRGRNPIPEVQSDSGLFGYKSFDPIIPPRKRWNRVLQRTEFLVTTLQSSSARLLPKSNSLLLQFFHVAQYPVRFLAGERLGIVERTRTYLRARWVDERVLLTT